MSILSRFIPAFFMAQSLFAQGLPDGSDSAGPGADASRANPIEKITVTGAKDGKSIYENPDSVLVLGEKDLPGSGRENSLQILNAVPNVEVNKNGESFSIRGINNTGVTGFQKDNLSTIVIDELFQTDLAIQAGSFNLWDLNRVEILRGPQSTSQGVNSLAGAIILDHHAADFSREGSAKLGVGSFGHRDVGVVVNEPIGERLAVRLSYDKEKNDGYIKNIATANPRWGGWEKDRARFSLRFNLSERDVLTFDAKVNKNDQGGSYVQGEDAFRREVAENEDNRTKTTNYQSTLKYARALSAQTTNSVLVGYSDSDQAIKNDADGTAQDTAGLRTENHNDHYVSVEYQLLHKSEAVTNLFGLHAHDMILTDDYDFNLLFPKTPGAATPLAVLQDTERTQRAYAIFDSFTYRLNAHHSILLGARGEAVTSRYGTGVYGRRTRDEGPVWNPLIDSYVAGISGSYDGDKTGFVMLPKISYGFTQGPHHAALSFTRGYRTSGVGINRRKATAHEYAPEFTNNFEVSYKHAGDQFRWGTNLFYTEWSDQQVQVQLSSDFYDTQVINAAKSVLYGGELEGKLYSGPHTVTAGAGYTDTKFKEFQTRNGNYVDRKFPFAAHWTARLGHEIKPTDHLSLFSVIRYVSESYTNAENTRVAEGQFYLNLNAKYAVLNWMLEGYVNNVLEGKYRIFDGTPSSPTSPYQARYHQTNTPREFGTRWTYFW